MEEQLTEWVQDYLEQDEDFLIQTDEQKKQTFRVYRTILGAVSRALLNNNVYPILVASNFESKSIIEEALNNLSLVIPEANKITVSLIH